MEKFSVNFLKKLVKNYYRFNAEINALSGYAEQNFLVADDSGKKYILKISPFENQIDFLNAQVMVLDFLSNSRLANMIPQCIRTACGKSIIQETIGGDIYYLRLLTYLEGVFWSECKNHSAVLVENLGSFLGQMDNYLISFSCPQAGKVHEWDLRNTLWAYEKVHYIKNIELRRVVHYFLVQFEMSVIPNLHKLRKSVVHNDANDYNILVKNEQIIGIIDFGDIAYTQTVNNLAIGCVYAMSSHPEPLKCAETMIKAYHRHNPLLESEIVLIYYLIAARLCISITNSADKRLNGSGNAHHFVTEMHAHDLIMKYIEINPIAAHNRFLTACGFPEMIGKSDYSSLISERKSKIGKNLSISYRKPIKIVQGALQYLYDDKGNTFIDCVNNVSHTGHCHPRLVKAMQKQIATLNTNTRYLHNTIIEYSNALLTTLPDNMKVCYFTNSGSEAVDLAVRMSRHFTQWNDIIVLEGAYHGTTTLAMELSPYKFEGIGGFEKKKYVHKALKPDLFRGKYKYNDQDAGKKYASDIEKIVNMLSLNNTPAAAFICESLLGAGGQMPLPYGYLKEAYRIIRQAGGVCIADEVQVGFGRVGKKFWGFQLQDVHPDIVVIGKPAGNGHPIAAVITTEEIADSFNNGMEYFNTFGGNPVSMVTGLEVLGIIREENLQEHALKIGEYLLDRLKNISGKHEIIGDVRGEGFFIGVEFIKDKDTLEPAVSEIYNVIENMKERGFLLSFEGPFNNVLKIKPPLVFSKKNADDLIDHLDNALKMLNVK